ncbi:SHOCT domain-containing protein [Streptomyces sp. NPDC016309]|uniref:SHOCT domain-containing protein n=1 Tax=Streptomyces sp. NPDC016309 TaxID=3364965 RepID=UPI0036FD0DAE
MTTLAHDGPGPWALFFPLFWAAVVFTAVTLLRRARRYRHHGRSVPDEQSPIALLGHRFAAGEIDEEEYWRRLSVLDEQFGRATAGGTGRPGKG